MMKNKKYNIIQIVIGIVIVIAIVYTIDFREVAELLVHLNFLFLALAVVAYLLNNMIIT